MKAAADLLDEILRHVKPPRGTAAVITEELPQKDGGPNWIASTSDMDLVRLRRFNDKLDELRKSDPLIDWDGVAHRQGNRPTSGSGFLNSIDGIDCRLWPAAQIFSR
jgi:hypothetical protein